MRLGELRDELAKLNPELEVLCYSEDKELHGDGHFFRLFDFVGVEVGRGVRLRGSDGVNSIRFENAEDSQEVALISITMDY